MISRIVTSETAQPSAVLTEKIALRQAMRQRRKHLDPAIRNVETANTLTTLQHLANWGRPLALYAAHGSELNLDPMITWLGQRGCGCFLPRVNGDQLDWRQIYSLDELSSGANGIREPRGPAQPLPPDCLVIIPGLAFARDGQRLGQGGGFYDRWGHSADPRTLRIGLGFSCQFLPTLPSQPHDLCMDGQLIAGCLYPGARRG